MVLFLLHNTVGAWRDGPGPGRAAQSWPRTAAERGRSCAWPCDWRRHGGYDFSYLRFVREPPEDDEEAEQPNGPVAPRGGDLHRAGRGRPRSCACSIRAAAAATSWSNASTCWPACAWRRSGSTPRRRRRGGAARQPVRPGDRPALHADRRVQPGPRRVDVARRRRPSTAAGAESRMQRPRPQRGPGRLDGHGGGGGRRRRAAGPARLARRRRLADVGAAPPTAWAPCTTCSSRRRVLGSLIDPRAVQADLLPARLRVGERAARRPARPARARTTSRPSAPWPPEGMARAAELLAGRYHLVITNVPYLAQRLSRATR